jgi:hypothetical protein
MFGEHITLSSDICIYESARVEEVVLRTMCPEELESIGASRLMAEQELSFEVTE